MLFEPIFECLCSTESTGDSYAVYIILFATVGLPLGTFLFLLLFFSLMRYRDIRRMIPFALLGAGLTWLVFEKILGVVVPQPFWVGLF